MRDFEQRRRRPSSLGLPCQLPLTMPGHWQCATQSFTYSSPSSSSSSEKREVCRLRPNMAGAAGKRLIGRGRQGGKGRASAVLRLPGLWGGGRPLPGRHYCLVLHPHSGLVRLRNPMDAAVGDPQVLGGLCLAAGCFLSLWHRVLGAWGRAVSCRGRRGVFGRVAAPLATAAARSQGYRRGALLLRAPLHRQILCRLEVRVTLLGS
mmetsp:Transcript_14059/g.39834  ORF Transcript_14059/g.39834 Transcript_14059/m.39834 type:complete len:206 (+) Transcript_14059:1928-2545(+)